MSKVIIIDGNNYCYRAYYQFKNMKSKDGKGSSIIYGVPLMISTLLKNHIAKKVYLVMDGDRNEHRLSVLPGYKQGRVKIGWDAEDFHGQKEVMMDLVHNCLGVTVIRNRCHEADDMMYKLVRRHKEDNILLCSSDKDFNQLISDKLHIWNHTKDVILTPQNLKEYFGYEPYQCVDFLTFIGDKSDKIPGVRGVGEKGAYDFLNKYDTIKNYLNNHKEDKKYKKDKLEKIYKINRFMIDLRYFHRKHLRKVKPQMAFKNEARVDYDKLKKIAIDYSINQFRLPNFIKTFK